VLRDFAEPSVAAAEQGARYQFERFGYFCADVESKPDARVFTGTVTLRDMWAKITKGGARVSG
jgi:glutaminyl-tRNA synthetase